MLQLLGFLMVLGGIALGTYVGLYVCFIGGIIDIIQQIKAPVLDAGIVAWGIAKIVLASIAGTVSGLLLVVPGLGFMSNK